MEPSVAEEKGKEKPGKEDTYVAQEPLFWRNRYWEAGDKLEAVGPVPDIHPSFKKI